MLSRLTITLETKEEQSFDVNISSLLHGVLMEHIDSYYAESLHQAGWKPYSQYIECKGNCIYWHIQTLSEDSKNNILCPLLDEKFDRVYLKHKDRYLNISDKQLTEVTYQQLIDETYFKDSGQFFNIRFLTPCAFKSRGKYVLMPTLKLIYQSLMNKFDSNAVDFSIKSDEVLEQLETYSEIVGYNLRSTHFHLEGVRIPSFVGRIGIKVHGPQPLVNLVHFMLAFGEYSGVGIKCALGMGGIRIIKKGGLETNE
jgi:CRISPR-associated endoribonuclease Cas6